MNTNALGTVAYWAIGLERSNVWRTMLLAYSGVQVIVRSVATGS